MYAEIYIVELGQPETTSTWKPFSNEPGREFVHRIEKTVDFIQGEDDALVTFNIFNADGTDTDTETL